ncbi:hypothetical protein AWV80_01205 [Cupriavidus sp. UYMU48A]|nr:hypothetical protein AWV80_01205 [Cupriavidus sp. UYMU48A]
MADTTNASLTSQGIRLECLRLAQRADKDADWIVERAKVFERFIAGPDQQAALPEVVIPEAPAPTDKATAKPRSKSS